MIQAEGANVSASASAEANAIKVSGNTLEFNILGGEKRSSDSILRALNPVWYEGREAKAREIKAESLKRTIDTLLEGCPVMTRQRAIMEAMGYRMTNEHAENFFAVADSASAIINEQGGAVNTVLPETRDSIVDGASRAYDDDARRIWSRILAEEINKPGSFSKRTMSILSDMSKRDIEIFESFCSACIPPLENENRTATPFSIVVEDESPGTYNGGMLQYTNLMQLESMGLIDINSRRFVTIKSKSEAWFLVGRDLIAVKRDDDGDGEVSFSPVLTDCGTELSALCELGCMKDIGYFFAKCAVDQGGFTVYSSTMLNTSKEG